MKMLDANLKRLFEELAESGLRMERRMEAMNKQIQIIHERQNETDRQMTRVFQEMAERSRRVDEQIERVDRQIERIDRQIERIDLQIEHLGQHIDRVDRQVAELAVQLGGIGNKFGSFTEGLVWSSLRRILFDKFRMDFVAPVPQRRHKEDGRNMEADMVGWTNGSDNRVVVVEIKSQLGVRDLDQLDSILLRFGEFFPEHRGKTAEGMIAAVGITEPMEPIVRQRGFHLAKASDDAFELADPVEIGRAHV